MTIIIANFQQNCIPFPPKYLLFWPIGRIELINVSWYYYQQGVVYIIVMPRVLSYDTINIDISLMLSLTYIVLRIENY